MMYPGEKTGWLLSALIASVLHVGLLFGLAQQMNADVTREPATEISILSLPSISAPASLTSVELAAVSPGALSSTTNTQAIVKERLIRESTNPVTAEQFKDIEKTTNLKPVQLAAVIDAASANKITDTSKATPANRVSDITTTELPKPDQLAAVIDAAAANRISDINLAEPVENVRNITKTDTPKPDQLAAIIDATGFNTITDTSEPTSADQIKDIKPTDLLKPDQLAAVVNSSGSNKITDTSQSVITRQIREFTPTAPLLPDQLAAVIDPAAANKITNTSQAEPVVKIRDITTTDTPIPDQLAAIVDTAGSNRISDASRPTPAGQVREIEKIEPPKLDQIAAIIDVAGTNTVTDASQAAVVQPARNDTQITGSVAVSRAQINSKPQLIEISSPPVAKAPQSKTARSARSEKPVTRKQTRPLLVETATPNPASEILPINIAPTKPDIAAAERQKNYERTNRQVASIAPARPAQRVPTITVNRTIRINNRSMPQIDFNRSATRPRVNRSSLRPPINNSGRIASAVNNILRPPPRPNPGTVAAILISQQNTGTPEPVNSRPAIPESNIAKSVVSIIRQPLLPRQPDVIAFQSNDNPPGKPALVASIAVMTTTTVTPAIPEVTALGGRSSGNREYTLLTRPNPNFRVITSVNALAVGRKLDRIFASLFIQELDNCFFAYPAVTYDNRVELIGFSRTEKLWPGFMQEIKKIGNIDLPVKIETITDAQCQAVNFAQNRNINYRRTFSIVLENQRIKSGEFLNGGLLNVRDRFLTLLLIDDSGAAQNLTSLVSRKGKNPQFSLQMNVTGAFVSTAQLLLAVVSDKVLESGAISTVVPVTELLADIEQEITEQELNVDVAVSAFIID